VPIVATATLRGNLPPSDLPAGTQAGEVTGGPSATLAATVSRDVVESLAGPSLMYGFAVRLGGEWVPPNELLGPFEIEASIDTITVLFSFGLVGRRWSAEATSWTWTRTPVEVWVTAGPPGGLRTWLRAFGYVLTCDQSEGPEPTLKVSCADPSALYSRLQLCAEIPTGAGLTRGAIVADILGDAGLAADVPGGALYAKALVTDSQRLWEFLAAMGEPEGWCWRFRNVSTVEAYTADLRRPPESPDDVWTLGDVVSVQTAPPAESPARWVVRSTQLVSGSDAVTIKRTRIETKGFYAPVQAASRQLADGSITALGGPAPSESFRTIALQEIEEHSIGTTVVYTVTRDWAWFNPRAAKLRSLGLPPGPVEDGYYYAEAYLDPDGTYRAWPRQAWVQTGEVRVTPTYDDNGTEVASRTETWRWHGIPMATRESGAAHPSVLTAGVGDDDQSWYPFQIVGAALRIEAFGLAQLDTVTHEYGDAGAEIRQVEETSTWYSARTAVSGVPWWVNYSGAGQRDMIAPFQVTSRKVTDNILTDDALLAGTVETTLSYHATRRIGAAGIYDWGDATSNEMQESLRITDTKLTSYNVLDEQTYERLVDGRRELLAGRPPRPRFKSSSWTQIVQAPLEVVLDDPAAEGWWSGDTQVLDLPFVQTPAEAEAVARRRRSRAVSFKHTVVRPPCQVRPGQTVLLIDPRAGICHRCLVTALKESWTLAPRPQVLATYTLEQPIS
jgi:hypothetical protein